MPSRIGHRVGRIVSWVFLAVFYVLGVLAACVAVVALSVAGAVRLGWSDVRNAHPTAKRGSHGVA